MSHFNKNLSPLLLLALFINVTTFSMNAKAILIDIHNFLSKRDWNVKIQCETPWVHFSPILFNMVTNMKSILLLKTSRAHSNGQKEHSAITWCTILTMTHAVLVFAFLDLNLVVFVFTNAGRVDPYFSHEFFLFIKKTTCFCHLESHATNYLM